MSVMIVHNKKNQAIIVSTAQEYPREIGDVPAHSTCIHQWDIVPDQFEREFKKRLAYEQSGSSCVIL